jgi:drug/metabolite transporter (DMT)-like permease
MNVGYLYMALSMCFLGMIGIFAKLADTWGCKPNAVYTFAYGWSSLFSLFFVIFSKGGSFGIPIVVYAIALPFGLAGAVAGIAFMSGIHYGKISTSWLIINLSAALPAVGSVIIYHEHMSARRAAVLVLALISLFLLWKDKQADERQHVAAVGQPGRAS